MPSDVFLYIIGCSICGNEVGKLQLPYKFWNPKTVNNDVLGYVDARCDSCSEIHGSFNELLKEAEVALGDSLLAENFVKSNRKREDFDKNIIKINK